MQANYLARHAINSSTFLLVALSIWLVSAGPPCNAVVEDTGPFFSRIEVEKKNGVYQLVAELTGGEEIAPSVEFLQVEFQTPSGIKDIMFQDVSTNEDGNVLVENEELKDLFIAIVGVHNYTAQATAQEVQGQTHGPDMLSCICVGACGDPLTADTVKSTCSLIQENITIQMAMAHKHAASTLTGNMTPASINVAPLQLGDVCEPNATETEQGIDQGQLCPPGAECMPKASISSGIKSNSNDVERYTCQLPFMQASAVHRVSAVYPRKSKNMAYVTFYYMCGSLALFFLLSMAISACIISRTPYKKIGGQHDSDEEFV